MGICGLIAYLICNGPEENTVSGRAKPLALRELDEEDRIFASYAADKQLQQQTSERLLSQGKHPDRYQEGLWGVGEGRRQEGAGPRDGQMWAPTVSERYDECALLIGYRHRCLHGSEAYQQLLCVRCQPCSKRVDDCTNCTAAVEVLGKQICVGACLVVARSQAHMANRTHHLKV